VLVIDASAVLELLLQGKYAEIVANRIEEASGNLHAPHLIDIEVTQILRRYCSAGEISGERVDEALRDLRDLPIARYAHDTFLGRIWDLRAQMTTSDAAYIALAEFLAAPLLTCDARHAAAEHDATVDLIAAEGT